MSDRVHDAAAAGRYAAPAVSVTRYRNGRFWAVWLDHELLAVTVYRKGAEAIRRELERRSPG